MGDNPTEKKNQQKLLKNQEETLTGSKDTTIGGDTKAIYWGEIKHLLMTIYLLRKYELHWEGRNSVGDGERNSTGMYKHLGDFIGQNNMPQSI